MVKDNLNGNQEFQVLTQVLEAEKQAQVQLDEARTQADSILHEAQNTARRVETRTDKRIQELHSQFRKKSAREKLHRKEAFGLEENTHGKPVDIDLVKEATKRLAQQIVGASQK